MIRIVNAARKGAPGSDLSTGELVHSLYKSLKKIEDWAMSDW